MKTLLLAILLVLGAVGAGTAQTTGYIDPATYGATCNNSNNDTNGWQSAVNAAWATGTPIKFHGQCIITSPITESTSPAGGQLVITSEGGGGVIHTSGNNLFVYTAPAKPQGLLISLSNFSIFSSSPNNGEVLHVDCSGAGGFCTQPGSAIENIRMTDVGSALNGIEVNNITIHHSSLIRSTPNSQQPFVLLQGPKVGSAQQYSADIFVTDNYVQGGILVLTTGGMQAIYMQNNKHLAGQRGFYLNNASGTSPEQIIIINNYLEESLNGIYLPMCNFCQIEQNSFDPTPSAFGGVSSGYFAIQVGTGGNAQTGNVVDHNYAFNFSGSTIANMFYDNMSNGGTFDHNIVVGQVAENTCMIVGSDSTASTGSTLGSVEGNTCWTAGTISVMGAVATRGNSYTLGSAPSTVVKVPDSN